MLIYLQMLDGPEDRSKFEQLYQHYKSLMFYVAHQILGNEKDAEDAVHEAFVAILENLEKISDVRCHKTKGYIVTIVESKAIDLYRKKQRHPTGEIFEELEGVAVEYDGDNSLTRCILKLPARYRDFILLRYVDGYSNGEIARIMGLSDAAVRKLAQRSKDRLEELCREEGLL